MHTLGRHPCRSARENPSFSSYLLDEIYRSIDGRDDQELMVYTGTTTEKQRNVSINGCFHNDREVLCKRRSAAYFKKRLQRSEHDSLSFNSSSSSSDSSLGGFSSSEGESMYGVFSRPKPIRASANRHDDYNRREKQRNTHGQNNQLQDFKSKPNYDCKFVKTKSQQVKIYGDLKKVKQPISPGGRLVTFLNSLFTTGNGKNTRLSSSSAGGYDDAKTKIDRRSKSANASACSSTSSFSRSCLSKTPSSRSKSNNNKNRSVRFFPVSVIVDEDCQPCGHKSLYGDESNAAKFIKNPITEELKMYSSGKNRRIEEAAKNLLRNYQKKVECELDLITNDAEAQNEIDMNVEDDEDDAASHTSSDLFELENFSAIGMERYGDELPVYETTHLNTNLAMAMASSCN